MPYLTYRYRSWAWLETMVRERPKMTTLPADYARCASAASCPRSSTCLRAVTVKHDPPGWYTFAGFKPETCTSYLPVPKKETP